MIRRAFALFVAAALMVAGLPGMVSAAGIKQNLGSVQGTILDNTQKPVPNACVQLRNVDTGQVASKSTSDKDGKYEFRDVQPGNYVVEAVNCNNAAVLAVSPSLALAAGPVTGVVLTLAGGAVIGGAAFFSGTAAAILVAGVGAGVTAVVAARNETSPK
jgi:hypothetical protein